MERKGIHIEPYRDTGIMGSEISLNEPVAAGFMEKADMRRDVVVTKKSGRERRAVESLGETLAFKRFALPTFGVTQRPTFELTKASDFFEVAVDDEKLAQEADDKMKKRYKKDPAMNGQEVFKQTYVDDLNHTLKEALKRSLLTEKLGLEDQDIVNYIAFAFYFVPLSYIASGDYQSAAATLSIGTPFLAFTNAIAYFYINPYANKAARHERNLFLPLLPVDSYLHGRLYLALKGHKLVSRDGTNQPQT